MSSCDNATWLFDTDPDLGDTDDLYDDAESSDDFDTPLDEGEAIMDADAEYSTDENGCVTDCYATIFCYNDAISSPPKTKKKRHVRIHLRHLPPIKKRIKKRPKAPILPGV